MEPIERYRGCLLGLAVGDAVGTTLEFQQPGSFSPIDDMRGGGPFGLKPGQWTDDTSMALCLADSLIKKKKFDPKDQLKRYLMWSEKGYLSSTGECFDIGTTTQIALEKFKETGCSNCGSRESNTAGNGSLMRLAPVPLYYANRPSLAIEMSGKSSETTHGTRTAVDACKYFGGLIVGALADATKDEILSSNYSPIVGYWKKHKLTKEIDEIAKGSFKRRNPPKIVGSGYVVKTLEAVLWSFHNSNSFKEGCLKVINLGHDSDTTGAIYGQLAGAFYGHKSIPTSWREKIAYRELVESMAEKIFRLSRRL